MLQLMREGCSYTYPPLSIARYSFIQLSELEQCRVKKTCPRFLTLQHRIRTRVLLVERPKLYHFAIRFCTIIPYTAGFCYLLLHTTNWVISSTKCHLAVPTVFVTMATARVERTTYRLCRHNRNGFTTSGRRCFYSARVYEFAFEL